MSREEPLTTHRRPRPATLKEVARAAGVHVSTVSRVLRQDEPPFGWTEAALRVRKVADELGYRPNLSAASLRTRQTMTLGVVMPRLTDSVAAVTCQAIEEAARQAGYQMLLASPPDEMTPQIDSINLLLDRQVDGLILSNLHIPADPALQAVDHRGVPVLLVSRHADSTLPSVTIDNRRGGYLATEHLIALGHRRIGLVGSTSHTSAGNDRTRGYLDALARAGIDPDPALIVAGQLDVAGGVDAGRRLLALPERPTAVFATNDEAALGVLGVARDMGITVPEQLSVVGFNDIPLVAQLPVPLTTVQTPSADMGTTAVARLLDLLADKPVESEILPVQLVVRDSTRTPE